MVFTHVIVMLYVKSRYTGRCYKKISPQINWMNEIKSVMTNTGLKQTQTFKLWLTGSIVIRQGYFTIKILTIMLYYYTDLFSMGNNMCILYHA